MKKWKKHVQAAEEAEKSEEVLLDYETSQQSEKLVSETEQSLKTEVQSESKKLKWKNELYRVFLNKDTKIYSIIWNYWVHDLTKEQYNYFVKYNVSMKYMWKVSIL